MCSSRTHSQPVQRLHLGYCDCYYLFSLINANTVFVVDFCGRIQLEEEGFAFTEIYQ